MKKIKGLPLVVSILALATLGGCDKEDIAAEQRALDKIFDMEIVLKNGTIGIFNDEAPVNFEDDEGDYLKLATSYFVPSEKQTVKIEWEIDSDDALFTRYDVGTAYDKIEFNYPNTETNFNFHITKVTSGSQSKDVDDMDFTIKLQPGTRVYDTKTVSELAHVTGGALDIIDYNATKNDAISPYYPPNNVYDDDVKTQYYVHALGKCTYLAPDGNWGIIQDGDAAMEIYAGSGTPLNSENFPALKVGNWVDVRGNMGCYNGNMQLGFITGIKEAQKGTMTEPSAPRAITDTVIKAKYQYADYNGESLMNTVNTITGTFVSGSAKNNDGKGVKRIISRERYTFKMKVGTTAIEVAFDYHTIPENEADKAKDNALIKALNSIIDGGTKSFTVTGTLRYKGTGFKPIAEATAGEWTIVPYLASQVK